MDYLGIPLSTSPKQKNLRLYACLALKPDWQALPRCSGKQICCLRRSAFKMVCGDHCSFSSISFRPQPSQRPDLRGLRSYDHGVVPLPVSFTLEALTMPVTRYSKQDQADHGKSRWSNLRSELGHFLLHPNPRQCIWKVGDTHRLYTAQCKLARALFFLTVVCASAVCFPGEFVLHWREGCSP